MNKKIIGLVIAISVVATLIGTGTWAFFSDTDTTQGNTFTAGTIDVEVAEDSTVIWSGEYDDLKPCMTGYKIIRITPATGSNPMEIWKHILEIEESDRDENGINDPECEAYGGQWISEACSGGTPQNDIDRYIHFDMWIEKSEADPDPKTVTYDDGVKDVMIVPEGEGWLLTDNPDFPWVGSSPDTNGVACKWIYIGQIDLDPLTDIPDEIILVQSFHLDDDVGNWAQSDQLTITEEILAQQIQGDTLPPQPDPVLPDGAGGYHGRPSS